MKAQQKPAWQPIETVPVNEPVLVYDGELQYVAVWTGNHWRGRDWLEAICWMPLPPPPPLWSEAEIKRVARKQLARAYRYVRG